ncbi:AraC family transcriptional regulator [Paenibacillus sp. FSL E2-8871]|uniref:helix-turn-helix transcriptional regulator n=1 Tax=unclassified Paenibacillus TaxID=185978 RepID=UPI0011F31CD1|nr:AraC family transcriptional regulator [Paenibacillus sp. B2(2019)]KAA1187663.1 helix-turn-helix transcriptional regulator [Paenibacillus sp. B2(2019)]
MSMKRSDGLNEAETIDAHKTLRCEGFSITYQLDGSHFEIKPPVELGEGSCRSLLTQRYLQMTDFDLQFNRDIEAKGEFRTPRTELIFCMGHGIEWGTSLKQDYFAIDTGESVLLHGGVRSENCIYLSGAGYRFLSIDMSPAQFERMTSGLTEDTRLQAGGGAGLFFGKNAITPSIRLILSQIADCSYSQGMRELYLEGKMLELMAVYLNESLFEADRISHTVKLSRDDMESLRLAKEILQRDYLHPPTLAGLSRIICLNEFKLKKGFKEIFGYTVHAYVIEQRMQRAQQLLEHGNMTVSEAASRVGYVNVSHFSAAFRKKFGVRPGEYLISGRQRSLGTRM